MKSMNMCIFVEKKNLPNIKNLFSHIREFFRQFLMLLSSRFRFFVMSHHLEGSLICIYTGE